jgi:4-diphosphocytidyl-2-C-methyl-D-erythritol kinase
VIGQRDRAHAKVNLCLFLGPTREDGRHELVTLFESAGPVDDVTMVESRGGSDEVVCEGVRGPNLATQALEALRESGWNAPPVRVTIEKRIPVAAGMGGGSADAAAVLRLAPRVAAVSPNAIREIAAALGSDVPGQLDPHTSIGTGAGDEVTAITELAEHSFVVVPQSFWLSTAQVYHEADRLGLSRSAEDLAGRRAELEATVAEPGGRPPAHLLTNDLQEASLSLRPRIRPALEAVAEAGAEPAIVCGSGPTVIGVLWGPDARTRAQEAVRRLHRRFPLAQATEPRRRGPAPGGEITPDSRKLRTS